MALGRQMTVGLIAALCWPIVAHADDPATRGAAIVEQWCRMCHLRGSDPPDPEMAPSFEEIVRRDGRDEGYFTRFMQEDHFPMTTFRLFDHEKADVIAWLVALRRHEMPPR